MSRCLLSCLVYSNRGINNPWGICTGLVCEKGWYTISVYGSYLSRSSEKSSRKLRCFCRNAQKSKWFHIHYFVYMYFWLIKHEWNMYLLCIIELTNSLRNTCTLINFLVHYIHLHAFFFYSGVAFVFANKLFTLFCDVPWIKKCFSTY